MLDLFSGIGGFSLAADWTGGIETVAFCEIEPFCQKVLKKHWPDVPIYSDIKELNGYDLVQRHGAVDIICGGFPCQDISYAKTWTTNGAYCVDGIDGSRSGLWKDYKRIISEIKPKFVVAENVKALTNKGLDVVLRDLTEVGYDSEWCIISPAVFGATHRRERIFIMAYPIGFGRKQKSILQGIFTSETIRQAPEWELSRTVCEANGKKTLPKSFGIYDGIPRGLHDADRIKALGNSIVPQVVYPIFQGIVDIEQGGVTNGTTNRT